MSKKFVIDRSKWRCGGPDFTDRPFVRGLGHTLLLNVEGFMCCLGQVSVQLGCKTDEVFKHGYPCDLAEQGPVEGVLTDNGDPTALAKEAVFINDDPQMDPDTREARLSALFREHGHDIAFIGDYFLPQ